MKARIQWLQDRAFTGISGSGHAVVMGRTTGPEGRSIGPSPMEMVLMGVGGCTAFDVIHILEKSREPVEGCVVELDSERAETDPQVFTRVHMRFAVTGRGLDAAKVERAVKLSAETYCSASAMIEKTAEITHEIEIIDSTAP
ncbi:MAG: OsmC family protein [Rhodospirillales bacterium]|jgi:putative redox protein|nr:OsmC family protein [Rhodospirillales bacterium]